MLSDLKVRLQTLVQASPLLTGRPVLIEDKQNLVSVVEQSVNTHSLSVVVSAVSGQVHDGSPIRRTAWDETFEVAIHRSLIDDDTTPSTDDVLDDLRTRIDGATTTDGAAVGPRFRCTRHELRENGDGTYVRVLTATTMQPQQ